MSFVRRLDQLTAADILFLMSPSSFRIADFFAASSDTLESHVSNSAIPRGKIRLSSLSVGDPPMHNTFPQHARKYSYAPGVARAEGGVIETV